MNKKRTKQKAGPATSNSDQRCRRLSRVPTRFKKLFERVYAEEASPRTAIKAQCLECNGFDRRGIAECPAVACPLWCFRPYQHKDQPLDAVVGTLPTDEPAKGNTQDELW